MQAAVPDRGRCWAWERVPDPKCRTRPALCCAAWSSSGSPGPDPMIVVDSCCYSAQINHDHGTSRAPGRRFMITEDLATGRLYPRSETPDQADQPSRRLG